MHSFLEKLDDYFTRYLANFNYRSYANRLNLQGNEQILEVGCGGGNLSRFLSEKLPSGDLVCLDNSAYWIKKSKETLSDFKNIEFVLGDVLNFKRKNYFDLVVVHYVLHDLIEKEKSVEVLSRSLKSSGKVYVREPIRKNHGMLSREIERLMFSARFEKLSSREGYSFPIRGKIYEGIFKKLS
ncbi:MAG: class I SAM-dependent methyltransferase [Nanoarchaeota archaeon]|nr:class I SAM-dependent methyltransferase [Nanoarchaeota archaeon]